MPALVDNHRLAGQNPPIPSQPSVVQNLTRVAPEDLYLAHRAHIEGAIGCVCRRHALSQVDAEDFAGIARLHFIDHDYAVLRKFQGRSSLKTYLVVVATHLYRDWCNSRWGKWRSSVEAKRLGPLGVQLERLIVRDGLTFEEAYETLRTNFDIGDSRSSLEALAAHFPNRVGRYFVSDDGLADEPASSASPELALREQEAVAAARKTTQALRLAIRALDPQDRLVIRLRFQEDLSIAEIARALHLEQMPLYRRIERIRMTLRRALEAAGITAAAAAEVLEHGGFGGTTEGGGLRETTGGVRPFQQGGRGTVQTTRTP